MHRSVHEPGSKDSYQRSKARTPSNPPSPLKEKQSAASFFGRVSNLSQVVSAAVSTYSSNYNKDRHFTLLVIDDSNTDWSGYFRGKKLHKDWDVRLEQAEFQDISLSATSSGGVIVTVAPDRAGVRTSRSFKPDLLLIRQNLKNATEDHKNILLGFQFGGVPSINSLTSVYNFQDKPWVYAHLRDIQQKLGIEKFPLINQQYFPDHRDMVPSCQFPCVFKVGHAHGGLGKVKVENETAYQDIASVVAVSGQYVTVEGYVEAKHDLHIFKIGDFYRAIKCSHCCDCRRPSISGNWKTNSNQIVVEEVPVLDRYKLWIDQVSQMFGGLSICSLEAVVGKDDSEHIIEVNDCAMKLMGETAEEDREMIAQLVLNKMEKVCTVGEAGHMRKSETIETDLTEGGGIKQQRNICRTDSRVSSMSVSGASVTSATSEGSSSTKKGTSEKGMSETSRDSDTTLEDNEKNDNVVEGEDTMKNLRTSFAGLFGSDLK